VATDSCAIALRTPPSQLPASWPRALGWLALTLGGSLLLGLAWVQVEKIFAPIVLAAILLGSAQGGVALVCVWLLGVNRPGWQRFGTALAALAAIFALHYAAYVEDTQRRSAELSHPLVPREMLSQDQLPGSFPAYLVEEANRRGRPVGSYRLLGPQVWGLWGLEAVLTVLAATCVVWPAGRWRACPRCRGWYRVLEAGTLSTPGTHWIQSRLDKKIPRKCEYVLAACPEGCGPWRLALGPPEEAGEATPEFRSEELWLDARQRGAFAEAQRDDEPRDDEPRDEVPAESAPPESEE